MSFKTLVKEYEKETKEEAKALKRKITSNEKKVATLEEKMKALFKERDNAYERLKELEDVKLQAYYDLLLDAMIVGASGFTVRHGMIAPYTHGYEVCGQVKLYGGGLWWKELPKELYKKLIKDGWTDKEFETLYKITYSLWNKLPKSYNKNTYTPPERGYRGHISNGYEVDGFSNIVSGKCQGDYSSMTTCAQNDLARSLIILKGYCPDYPNAFTLVDKSLVEKVYARHSIDSDLSDMVAWAKRNPNRSF